MHLLLLSERIDGGGAEQVVQHLASLLHDHGHHVTVLSAQRPADVSPNRQGICYQQLVLGGVHRWSGWFKALAAFPGLGRFAGLFLSILKRWSALGYSKHWIQAVNHYLADLPLDQQPDVIHVHHWDQTFPLSTGPLHHPCVVATLHTPWAVCPAETLTLPTHQPCAMDCLKPPALGQACEQHLCIPSPIGRGLAVHQFKALHQRPVFRFLRGVTTPSRFMLNAVQGLASTSLPVAVVPNPLGSRWLSQPAPHRDRFLTQSPVFLAVGQWVPHKGFELLLEVFAQRPELTLLIAGDGPERKALEDRIRTEQLHHIHLLGWQTPEQLQALYHQARATIVPSQWQEPLGLVVAESMACGTPVIASHVGGIPELVDHGQTGFLVPPTQPHALLRVVDKLAQNPDLAYVMGQAAHQFIHQTYAQDTVYQAIMTFYEQALTSNKGQQKPQPRLSPSHPSKPLSLGIS